jgi:hypothetical protein
VQVSNTTALRSYRATLIPKEIELDEVEFQAGQGLLPTLRLKAATAEDAAASAYRVTGRRILKVERVEVPA